MNALFRFSPGRFFLGLLGFIAVIIGFLWFAPHFIPADSYRNEIHQKLEALTGRDVTIGGDVALRFLPRLSLSLGDVSMSHPEGFAAKTENPFAKIDALHVSLQIIPLISGRVVIDRFELEKPELYLQKDANGQPNWEFTPEGETKETEAETDKTDKVSRLKELNIATIAIREGRLAYQENAEAEPLILAPLNASLNVPSLFSKARFTASTLLNGEQEIRAEGSFDTPGKWMNKEAAALSLVLDLGGKAGKASFEGTIKNEETLKTQGVLEISVPSVAHLLSLFTGNAPDAPETALNIHTNLRTSGQQVKTSKMVFTFGDATLNGDLVFMADAEAGKPGIAGVLESAEIIDISALTPNLANRETQPQKAAEGEPENNDETTSKWSRKPVIPDLSWLDQFVADISITTAGLKSHAIETGAFPLMVKVRNGVLTATITAMELYGGTANAAVSVNGTASMPKFQESVSFTGINAGPLLRDAYGFDRLSGTANGSYSINSRGRSLHDLVGGLQGDGKLHFTDGAVKGINLAALVRKATRIASTVLNATAPASESGGKTDFASLSGSFTIAGGVLTNPDLNLQAPLLTVTGSGTVNLPQKRLDYRLEPSLVASAEGQERTQETSGALTIPIRVAGPFDSITFKPDAKSVVEDLVKDPKGTVKKLEENVKGLEKDLKGLIGEF